MEQYAISLANFLQHHPAWGGTLTFFIAFLESLAVVGTIIPGSITMTAVGMLIGIGVLPFCLTLFWAILGAFLGDILSYWIGVHYNERLRQMWPFKTHPRWLQAGELFFKKHGGKSIIIGRFIGPLRSLMPLIAGLLQMSLSKFLVAALPSAALWALVYVFPGIILGALSLKLPPSVATKFILGALLLILCLSLFAWFIRYCFQRAKTFFQRVAQHTWLYLRSYHRYDFFTKSLLVHNDPDNYQQLVWLTIALISFVAFMFIFIGTITHSLHGIDQPIFEFLRSIRAKTTDKIMVAITLLGDGIVLLTSGILMLIYFIFRKQKRAAFYWTIALFIGIVIPNAFKYLLTVPRPSGLLHPIGTSSFPSGHVFFSVLFYGFLTVLISSHMTRIYRGYLYWSVTLIVLLIGLSRLYFGAHWLTDILASLTLGLAFLSLLTIGYRRYAETTNSVELFLVALISTGIIWGAYTITVHQQILRNYALLWPSKVIPENNWWGEINPALPIYRQNRFGKPVEPMNIQFAGDADELKEILQQAGWSNVDMTLLKTTLEALSTKMNNVVSLFPALYLNKPPVILMVKITPQEKLVLTLWNSNVNLSENWNVLYIGNIIEYTKEPDKKKTQYSYNVQNKLLPYLRDTNWKITAIRAAILPKELIKQYWDGVIVQISSPTHY